MDEPGGRPVGSIQPISGERSPDPLVVSTGARPLWTCPRCGYRFVTGIEELAPGWIIHRFEVHEPAELDDRHLAQLICESYRKVGAQGRLRTGRPVRG